MNQFSAYLEMGFGHISDWKGYDHILFIVVLCAVYQVSEWRKMAVLITAFTIGHSVTLALSALKIFVGNAYLIEILIPVTILITSLHNLALTPSGSTNKIVYNYILVLCFGFIHGMGFSNYFNALMSDSMNIGLPLLAFNLGLELGQLLIVSLFFTLHFFLNKLVKFPQRDWTVFFSGAGAGIATLMIIERIATK
ncbi:MAG: HupE/UreJ family protein [Opitutaceae bacterium]|nr:HupE/UreJ family protein [Cytophagales bacterium]